MLLSSPINGRLRQLIDIATDRYEADLARRAAERVDALHPADVVAEMDEIESSQPD
jgi:hypothetical protein